MLRLVAVSLMVVAVCLVRTAPAAEQVRLDAERIKAGLQTAEPEEHGFVERVVNMANAGRLPAVLVESTFEWARKKTRWKFQYFKRGLIVRAAKIGIQL